MLKFPFILLSSFNLIYSNDHVGITKSPFLLDKWAKAEITFVEMVKLFPIDRKRICPMSMRKFESYLKDFDESNKNLHGFKGTIEEKILAITHNPLATFRMIRRILKDLQPMRSLLLESQAFKKGAFDKAFSLFLNEDEEEDWLEEVDFKDSIAAILRISDTYGLQAKHLANGVIIGLETGIKLRALHCFEIGTEAMAQNYHVQGIEWLEEALARLRDGTITKAVLEDAYKEALEKHDKSRSDILETDLGRNFDRELAPIRNNSDFKSIRQSYRQTMIENFKSQQSRDWTHNYPIYWLLCSGENLQTAKEKAKLFCWYEGKSDPFWYIGPIKMELLSRGPDVVQMYDVIGDAKIQRLKEAVSEDLHQSKVFAEGGDTASPTRTSVQSWIHEPLYADLKVIQKNVEKLTGLNVVGHTAAEMLQVAAYTFSGHYFIHLDALPQLITEMDKANGNRVATFMYYLEQPKLGGQTIFSQAGVAAQPIKGSAVFWYDLMSDGTIDELSYHGACPVVYGRKWVSNKWIRHHAQMLNRKSDLKPNQRFKIHSKTRGANF